MVNKFFVLIIMVSTSFAQSKVDSIISAIYSRSTIEQINILNDFSWSNRDIDPVQAIRAAETALKLAENSNDKSNQAKSLNFLSVIYRDQGAYDKSLAYSTHSLQLAQSVNDLTQEAYSNNNISTIYRLMGNYPAAIEKLYKALEIFERIKDKVGIAYCYYNLGLVYMKQENFDKALENFESTIKIREHLGDIEGRTKALVRVGEIYLHKKDDKKAFSIFSEVEKTYRKIGDQRSLIVIRMGLAEVYKRNNDYEKALNERKLALDLSEKFNDVLGIVTNSSELGVLYALRGNLTEGGKFLEQGRKTAHKYDSSELKLINYKNYTDFFEIQKDFAKAFMYAKLLKEYQDSVSEKQKNTAISEVEAAYKVNKKEKEKELLQSHLERQSEQIRYAVLIGILLIGLATISTILYFFKKKTSEKLTELNATKDKFFSIIAHDLKNPITTQFGLTSLLIEDYKDMNDNERLELIRSVDNAGKQTYRLLENLLYWSRSQTGRLDYLPTRLNLNMLIDECFDLLMENAKYKNIKVILPNQKIFSAYGDEDMIKTVLRNLISNAIKYSKIGSSVKIELEEKDEKVIVSISDEGIGISTEQLNKIFKIDTISSIPGTSGERGTGLGLILCKEFVEKNGGTIWVQSELDKGSKFSFSLPAYNEAVYASK